LYEYSVIVKFKEAERRMVIATACVLWGGRNRTIGVKRNRVSVTQDELFLQI
jgi:hypothetical protein